VELQKDGWEYVGMFWCQSAQNTELSNNHKICANEHRMITMHTRSRRTGRRTNIMIHDSSATTKTVVHKKMKSDK